MKYINIPLLAICCLFVRESFPQPPLNSYVSLNPNPTALPFNASHLTTINTQGCVQSPSMPLDLSNSRSQREAKWGQSSRWEITKWNFNENCTYHWFSGFAGKCPNCHTPAIWHIQSGTHLCLMSFKSLWLLLRTGVQGNLARAHQPAKDWQRLGQRGPSGQS